MVVAGDGSESGSRGEFGVVVLVVGLWSVVLDGPSWSGCRSSSMSALSSCNATFGFCDCFFGAEVKKFNLVCLNWRGPSAAAAAASPADAGRLPDMTLRVGATLCLSGYSAALCKS